MCKTKSIGDKLKTIKSYQAQERILSDWVKNWKEDQERVLKKLRWAVKHDEHEEIMHMLQQMEEMTEKRFNALNNVMRTLSDSGRVLKNLSAGDEGDEEKTKVLIRDIDKKKKQLRRKV